MGITASGNPRKQEIETKIGTIWVPRMQEYTWTLVPQKEEHNVHPCGRGLCCKICQQGRCRTFNSKHQIELQTYRGLDREPLLRNLPRLGLCKQMGGYINAGLHKEKTTVIRTRNANKIATVSVLT